jgi:hypothetical protein
VQRVCKSLPGDPRFRACQLDRDGEGLVATDNCALATSLARSSPSLDRRGLAAAGRVGRLREAVESATSPRCSCARRPPPGDLRGGRRVRHEAVPSDELAHGAGADQHFEASLAPVFGLRGVSARIRPVSRMSASYDASSAVRYGGLDQFRRAAGFRQGNDRAQARGRLLGKPGSAHTKNAR